MIWGAIILYGVSPLKFIEGRQDSMKYREGLPDGLSPLAADVFGERQSCKFQKYNARIYTFNMTTQWMANHSISTLSWPPRSPNVEIIENVCRIMARTVYARGKHYSNVEDSKVAIEEA